MAKHYMAQHNGKLYLRKALDRDYTHAVVWTNGDANWSRTEDLARKQLAKGNCYSHSAVGTVVKAQVIDSTYFGQLYRASQKAKKADAAKFQAERKLHAENECQLAHNSGRIDVAVDLLKRSGYSSSEIQAAVESVRDLR